MPVPPGRPPLPPELRKPRTSGKVRQPTAEEAADQQARLAALAERVGHERWRRGEAAREPATWAQLAAVLGHATGDTMRRAALPVEHPRSQFVRPETLVEWEKRVAAWTIDRPE